MTKGLDFPVNPLHFDLVIVKCARQRNETRPENVVYSFILKDRGRRYRLYFIILCHCVVTIEHSCFKHMMGLELPEIITHQCKNFASRKRVLVDLIMLS